MFGREKYTKIPRKISQGHERKITWGWVVPTWSPTSRGIEAGGLAAVVVPSLPSGAAGRVLVAGLVVM